MSVFNHWTRAPALLLLCALSGCGFRKLSTDLQSESVESSAEAARSPLLPLIRRETLANGLTVWIAERPGMPRASVRYLVGAGYATESLDGEGVATLAPALLLDSSAQRSGSFSRGEFTASAGHYRIRVGEKLAAIDFTTPVGELLPALEEFSTVLMEPRFDAGACADVRERLIARRHDLLDDPSRLADAHFAARMRGDEGARRRYLSYFLTGERIATSTLREFHENHYLPNNSHLVIVGDVQSQRLVPEIRRIFGQWRPGPTRDSLPTPRGITRPDPRIYLIDRPGAFQSELRIGQIAPARSHADYPAVLLLARILGGEFTSRLNMRLREENGYTYGASASVQSGAERGFVQISTSVEVTSTVAAIEEVLRELRDIQDGGVLTHDEVDSTLLSMTRSEALMLQTNEQILAHITEQIHYPPPAGAAPLPPQRWLVTPHDVERVAREYLPVDGLVMVVIGDRAIVESELGRLQYPVREIGSYERLHHPGGSSAVGLSAPWSDSADATCGTLEW